MKIEIAKCQFFITGSINLLIYPQISFSFLLYLRNANANPLLTAWIPFWFLFQALTPVSNLDPILLALYVHKQLEGVIVFGFIRLLIYLFIDRPAHL